MQRFLATPFLVLGLLFMPLVGCATADSQEISGQDYSQPHETIRAAEAMGANEVPRARMFLSYAEEQVRNADRAIEAGENNQARMLLARAQADADLALSLAQEQQVSEQVRQIDQRIERLREDID